jgi:hypothetical protein
MRYSDLIKEYRRLHSIRANAFIQNGVSEKAVSIHETDQIRILLVRKFKDPDSIRMEVEVMLSEELWGLEADFFSNEFSSSDQSALRMSLEDMIILFQYLIDLQKAGFHLDFYSTEGVWVASYDFDKEPSKNLFTRLKPPGTRAN